MPHIIVEATSLLAMTLPFRSTMLGVHQQMANLGYAKLNDFKSRLIVIEQSVVGEEERQGEFVAARLILTNPRPTEMQYEMATVLHNAFRNAIELRSPDFWWQCCVFIENIERRNYLKTDSAALVSDKM